MFVAVVRALCAFLFCSTVQCTVAQEIVLFSEQISDDDDDDDDDGEKSSFYCLLSYCYTINVPFQFISYQSSFFFWFHVSVHQLTIQICITCSSLCPPTF